MEGKNKDGGVLKNKLDFIEHDHGFTTKEAIAEAKRCLNCAKPLCKTGCPIENDIPNFIAALAAGNVGEAYNIIARKSNLPAVCGRVCPHEKQCEGSCVMNKAGKPVQIGKLERFIADFDAEMNLSKMMMRRETEGKIAVIGSGPAGLTVAGDLAKEGFYVTVYDSQPEFGGVLMYGIPEFRLNKDVVRREVKKIAKLGVQFRNNVMVGPDITVDTMFGQGFDAIFIGSGTALPRTLDIPGNELSGVLQATYFLRTVQLAKAGQVDAQEVLIHKGDRVVIIGAGNVAMDAARSALRLGAAEVTVTFLRVEADITALRSEYEDALKEGVRFRWLTKPCGFVGEHQVEGMSYADLEIAEDGSLRETGTVGVLPADAIILAIGQRPAARIVSTTQGIDVGDDGYVITRERPYGMTTKAGVFAGGDVVHEPATVVLAMREAKKVAQGIAEYVRAKKLLEFCKA